jgi:DNA-directed RNA polymerase subunit RPC12/RpoP
MLISIGDITAACPRCGGKEFEPQSEAPLRLATELKCPACGGKVKYLVLLDQIGEEAMRRANQALEELKKRPKQ